MTALHQIDQLIRDILQSNQSPPDIPVVPLSIEIVEYNELKIGELKFEKYHISTVKTLQTRWLGPTFDKQAVHVGGTAFSVAFPNWFISNLILQNKIPGDMTRFDLQQLSFYLTHKSFDLIHGGKRLASLYGICSDLKYVFAQYIGTYCFCTGDIFKLFEGESLKSNKDLLYYLLESHGPILCTIDLFENMSEMLLLSLLSKKNEFEDTNISDHDLLDDIITNQKVLKINKTYFYHNKAVISDGIAIRHRKCKNELKQNKFDYDDVALNDLIELKNGLKGTVKWRGIIKTFNNLESSLYFGIMLNEADIRGNNGCFGLENRKYFDCAPYCGYFARENEIKSVNNKYAPQQIDVDIKECVGGERHNVVLVGIDENKFIFLNSHATMPIFIVDEDCAVIQQCDAMAVNIKSFDENKYKTEKSTDSSCKSFKPVFDDYYDSRSISVEFSDDDYDSDGRPM